MTGFQLIEIAKWIDEGELSFSQAVSNYNLSADDKKKLKGFIKSAKDERKLREAPIRAALLEDMRDHPSDYYAERVCSIIDKSEREDCLDEGAPEAYKAFLNSDVCLTFDEIAQELNLPRSINQNIVCSGEFPLPEYYISEYTGNILPKDQTDLFFLGAAGTGKSSLISSIIHNFVEKYQAEADYQKDNIRQKEYLEAVLSYTKEFQKFPVSSDKDMLLFCQLKFKNTRKHISIIDCGARGLVDLAKLRKNSNSLNIYNLLNNENNKIIFFLIDYGVVVDDNSRTISNQSLSFESALHGLMHDGIGENYSKGCSLSKTKVMGIIFTKCDVMNESPSEIQSRIDSFMNNYMQNFTNLMCECFGEYNINKQNDFKPYILSHSLGRVTVGNTLLYNPNDSYTLAKLIYENIPNRSIFSFLG